MQKDWSCVTQGMSETWKDKLHQCEKKKEGKRQKEKKLEK
jgi:hypothetical protein